MRDIDLKNMMIKVTEENKNVTLKQRTHDFSFGPVSKFIRVIYSFKNVVKNVVKKEVKEFLCRFISFPGSSQQGKHLL